MHGLKYSRSLNTYRCQKRSVLQPGTAASVTQCVFWQQTDDLILSFLRKYKQQLLIELPRCIDRKASATRQCSAENSSFSSHLLRDDDLRWKKKKLMCVCHCFYRLIIVPGTDEELKEGFSFSASFKRWNNWHGQSECVFTFHFIDLFQMTIFR